MDKFAWGCIITAVVIEAFVVYGWYVSPQDWGAGSEEPPHLYRGLLVASAFPVVLVLATLLFYWLQKDA